MLPSAGLVGRVLLILALLAVLTFVGGAIYVYRHPLAVDARVSRYALGKAGLVRTDVEVPFGRVSVWQGGSGPTVVLLHGAGDQAGAWARAVPRLIERYRLVIPDLAGHGASDPRTGPIHMEQILTGVEATLDARAAGEPVVLVGNSLGAWVALLEARARPDHVTRVVAVNGGAIQELKPGLTLLPRTRAEASKLMDALTGPKTPPVPNWVLADIIRQARVGPLARFAATAGEMGPFVLDGRLAEVTVPVDLLWGDADKLFDLDYARRMLDGLPAARLTVLPGCGHVPERECPTEFDDALIRLLDGPPPTPRTEPEAAEAGS